MIIISVKPNSRKSRAVTEYQIAMTLCSAEKTYFRKDPSAGPQDAAAYRGLASGLWLSITFRRGNMTVDDYLGKITRPTGQPPPPPAEVAAAFREALDRALALSRTRVAAAPREADAHYQL